ncbi:hypothetical protein ASPVEDRAFT_199612 [Aspergillus versicolor CBS 583.65]|uniref:Alpha/beta hydrolase fold-3 domain-containing protein n=1 Tax=Aspergillus versicolor CBS 583.65 TaxID=1036611 RepID=A0A1L9PWV8_ASPVE|nr:uncharacterized protein ASPVEDRAFT_199612 [Aspergillus versicolor CBS 583.65]OJJ06030.1 hypothetical protein ASPVEDRAFT_199612 [Aspergillus versicolor CBS 583.65]
MADLADPKYHGFDIIHTSYKHVGDHSIRTDILVPQTPHSGKRPTIVRFHGGGLILGDSLYPGFWSQWLSDLALRHNAVIISPNYRLLPQATGLDIYNDIEDFWTWLKSPTSPIHGLLAAHSNPTELDLSRILLAGESAGGLLSINTALGHAPDVRAATALYPCVDLSLSSADFSKPRPDSLLPFGQRTPVSVVEEYLASLDTNKPVSSTDTPSYVPLMLAVIEHGIIGEWYTRGLDKVSSEAGRVLFPIQRLDDPGVTIPRGGITIVQGRQDSVVPPHHSVPFVERAREVASSTSGAQAGAGKTGMSAAGGEMANSQQNGKVALVFRDGEHGFDAEERYEDGGWVKEALGAAVEAWLEVY